MTKSDWPDNLLTPSDIVQLIADDFDRAPNFVKGFYQAVLETIMKFDRDVTRGGDDGDDSGSSQ